MQGLTENHTLWRGLPAKRSYLLLLLLLRAQNIAHTLALFVDHGIINNYSPKWRWLVVDIYRAAKRRGKYSTLATDTELNSCFSIY